MTYYGHLCMQSAKEAALQRALAAEGLIQQLQEDNEQQVQEHRRAFQQMADTCRESEALHQQAVLALQVSEVWLYTLVCCGKTLRPYVPVH